MKISSSKNKLFFLSIVFVLGIGIQNIQAQKKKKKKSKKGETEQVDTPKKDAKEKTIEELTKKSKKIEGLFTIYRDSTDGSTKMLIKKDQIGKEFIYFSQISDGVLEAGAFRGAYLNNKVFKIEKHYNKIEFVTQNASYYFDKNNALSKAAEANISEGIMASLKIEAKDEEKGLYLIKSDDLFLKETFEQIKAPNFPGQSPFAFKLGSLSKEKTKIKTIKNYPENTNINSHLVYSKSSIINGGSSAVTDGRNVTIKVEHSLIAMPDNDYKPRFDDPRVGYFFTQVTDMTSASPTPYRDLVHRWNLIKKDPGLALSEPVEPITWWIENTTPIEFRETIKEAVLEWNKAFEKAGFKNAVAVKIQPDDAEWDAGDIRYNVLRWTSSPRPPFGGYGPSFVNPRTGEIMGADIMLEYVYHTNRVMYDKLFNLTANNELEQNNYPTAIKNKQLHCSYGHIMQENSLFGQAALAAYGANDNEMKGMRMEAMKELIMHEVGHTLGLNHNMKASQLFSPEQLNDPEFIKGKCLTGSVMDYTVINVANDKLNQGQYFSTTVGPYDEWAIQYGYTPVNSKAELENIANQSNKAELIFGNDADDMRSPGKAIDPRVMTGDLSNDQITYSINRMELVNELMPKIKSKFSRKGQSYQELRQSFYILRGQYGRAGDVISRFIGGVYVDRSMVGQDSNAKPFTPVSYEDQKRAMNALKKYVFAPNAYKAPNDLYNHIAMQRRGYNFFGGPEDPKIHALILNYQQRVLNHIMHPNTLQRITDSELYGNTYKLSELMTDLNTAIFQADAAGSINTFRQNLQLEYTKRLIGIVSKTGTKGPQYTYASKSMALYNLKRIRAMVSNGTGDKLSKAHKDHLRTLINNTIEEIK
ncbi:zinc-dependent metalloprotease [Aquimarina sp. 2201CG14-23]|uniref:zinc-dependent metalloprotease n=1 Tax=Aquimarina mycalae TaxID=3040073 RepID=UPI0024782244|nr:zinc-dependent metalloprotease [Aquimarina sp. 2201CG14-23]MDH7444505.1 zinc-dependent metalloprotease [Aquimarina sp. 2201CG14-23]